MARPVRLLFEGAYYHVINRGQSKREVFLDEKDYEAFLKVIRETCQTYKVNVVAYCLMRNHYHLIVYTPNANLPGFMRQLGGVYTQFFNRKYKQDGPLFKGRYKAIVVQEGSYLLRLIRYIHKNPIRAKIVERLDKYRYSSHGFYTKEKESEWLKFKDILKGQWRKLQNFKKAYLDFMKKEDQELEEYLQEKSRKATDAIILGDDEFTDTIKMNYLHGKRVYGDVPQAKHIKDEMCFKKVKREIIKEFKIEEEMLYISKRGKENLARLLAIGLLRECSGMTYRGIGYALRIESYKSVAKYAQRMKGRYLKDQRIKNLFDRLKVRCI
ncbi:MAG: transposase [Candidatus Omnitrophota bacterium]